MPKDAISGNFSEKNGGGFASLGFAIVKDATSAYIVGDEDVGVCTVVTDAHDVITVATSPEAPGGTQSMIPTTPVSSMTGLPD